MQLGHLLPLLLIPAVAFAQHSTVWRSWRMADGLYESYVHSLAKGVDGSIWVAHGRNIRGITLLDGPQTRTVEFKPEVRPFDRLFGEPGGGAWGLTPTGFFLIDPAGTTSKRSVPGVAGAIAAQPLGTGKALLLTPDRLLLYDFASDTVTPFWDGRRARIGAFSEMSGDPDAGLWIAGERGVGRLRRAPGKGSGEWEWTEFPGLPPVLTNFRFLATSTPEKTYVTATEGKGSHVVMEYDGRRWAPIYRSGNANARGWSGADTMVWVRDGDRLFWKQDGGFRPIEPSAVQSDAIREVLPEPSGAFWLATNDGVVRNAPLVWRAPAGSELQVPVYAVEKDGAGGLWFLLQDQFLHHAGGRWESIAIPEQWRPMALRSGGLLVLPDGNLVCLTPSRKLLRYDPRSRQFSETAPPGNAPIEAFSLRGDGTAWVATREGGGLALFTYDGTFHPRSDLHFQWDAGGIVLVAQTSDGSIWVGGTNRLAVYRNGQYRLLGPKDGYDDSGVFSILEVQPGRVWFGGRRSVTEFDGHGWKVLRKADRTRAIVPAKDGSVWTASTDGVFHYRDGVWLEYGAPEGLSSSIAYSVREDTAGRIWAVTTRGISVFHPEADPDPPRAILRPEQNPSEAPTGEVRVLFSAVDRWDYTTPDRMLCSYRIDSQPWSAFDECRPAVFPALARGPHHFEVQAIDRTGNRSRQAASYDFSVVPPWYLSAGFLAAAGGTAVVVSGLVVLLAFSHTHRGRLIAQLRKANAETANQRERAELASVSKGRFLANMSHEIRTPMNGVLGMAELARNADTAGEREEYLLSLQQSARSLLVILNDILDLSKIEAGKLELAHAPFRLRDCFAEAIQPLAVTAGQKGLELILRVGLDVPETVIGDTVRLRQVLVNLVGNAVKFTREGEVALEISVGETAPGSVTLRFRVRDTGPGVPADKRELIFQAFEQADGTARDVGGAGLGLAIAVRFVEMMGGRISVESPATPKSRAGGPGAEFCFDAAFLLPAGDSAGTTPRFAGMEGATALVIEDNASARLAMTEAMGGAGMRVEAVADADGALREIDAGHFTVIVVDQSLPDTDGAKLAARIRVHPKGAGARILLLKSAGRPSARASVEEGAADAVLYKPVEALELLRSVAGLLEPSPSVPERAAAAGEGPAQSLRPLRILVAEDNAVNQTVARRLLEKRGHRVKVARDGMEAVEAATDGGFDVMLMDLEMPVMNGWEATIAIRAGEAATGRRRLPIVALTAHAMKGQEARCRDAGMDGYIAKPIEVGALDAMLEEVGRNPEVSSNG